MLKQTTVFDVSFNLRAIVKMLFGNSMILPAAWPCRCLSLSQTYSGWSAESVVGCEQVFFVLMDAAVSACTFPRSSVVVNYNQLYSEMRNVSARFYDVTTRMLCFVLQDT